MNKIKPITKAFPKIVANPTHKPNTQPNKFVNAGRSVQ